MKTCNLFIFVLLALAGSTFADDRPNGVEPEPDRDDRMAWWREAKFGMFVHWGNR